MNRTWECKDCGDANATTCVFTSELKPDLCPIEGKECRWELKVDNGQ